MFSMLFFFIIFIINQLFHCNIVVRVVLFTRNECESCTDLKHIFSNLMKINEFRQNVSFKIVDCNVQKVCYDARIRSIPTIRFYQSEYIFVTYDGLSTVEALKTAIGGYAKIVPEKMQSNQNYEPFQKFRKFKDNIQSLLYLLLVIPTDVNQKSEQLEKFNKLANYFQKNGKLDFIKFYCKEDIEYCQSNKVHHPILLLFYHGVEVMRFSSEDKFEELILSINDILNKYPTDGQDDYIPTITVSESYSNLEVLNSKLLLLLIFSEKCVHCKKFLPEWESMSIKLRKKFPKVTLAKVNCQNDFIICRKLQISSVPSLMFFKEGRLSQTFIGAHDYNAIVELVEANTHKEL